MLVLAGAQHPLNHTNESNVQNIAAPPPSPLPPENSRTLALSHTLLFSSSKALR